MKSTVLNFDAYLATQSYISLPGGVGTSLQLEGYALKPEAWSGEANLRSPELVRRVHHNFHAAGVHIHTSNTFRTHEFFMKRVCARFKDAAAALLQRCRDESICHQNFSGDAQELSYWASKHAVDILLTIQKQSEQPFWVGGSYGPINDTHSYDKDEVVKPRILFDQQRKQAFLLKELGVQILFPETLPTRNEVIAATCAAEDTGLPYVTSLVLDPETGRLFDGTTIKEAVAHAGKPSAILFNCTPVHVIGPALDELLSCYDGVVGAYPNGGGGPASDNVHWDHDHSPEAIGNFVDTILSWRTKDPRVKMIGGCCGASPAYIQKLNQALKSGFVHTAPRTRLVAEAVDIDTPALACGCASFGQPSWPNAAPGG